MSWSPPISRPKRERRSAKDGRLEASERTSASRSRQCRRSSRASRASAMRPQSAAASFSYPDRWKRSQSESSKAPRPV